MDTPIKPALANTTAKVFGSILNLAKIIETTEIVIHIQPPSVLPQNFRVIQIPPSKNISQKLNFGLAFPL